MYLFGNNWRLTKKGREEYLKYIGVPDAVNLYNVPIDNAIIIDALFHKDTIWERDKKYYRDWRLVGVSASVKETA